MTIRQAFPTNGFWQRVCIKVSVVSRLSQGGRLPAKKKKNNKNEKGDHL